MFNLKSSKILPFLLSFSLFAPQAAGMEIEECCLLSDNQIHNLENYVKLTGIELEDSKVIRTAMINLYKKLENTKYNFNKIKSIVPNGLIIATQNVMNRSGEAGEFIFDHKTEQGEILFYKDPRYMTIKKSLPVLLGSNFLTNIGLKSSNREITNQKERDEYRQSRALEAILYHEFAHFILLIKLKQEISDYKKLYSYFDACVNACDPNTYEKMFFGCDEKFKKSYYDERKKLLTRNNPSFVGRVKNFGYTKYSLTNPNEMFADAFMLYMANDETMDENMKKVVENVLYKDVRLYEKDTVMYIDLKDQKLK